MRLTPSQTLIAVATTGYTAWFGFRFFQAGNFEFIAYVLLLIGIFGTVFGTLRYTKFPNYMVWGLSMWGLLHMIGGTSIFTDGVTYSWRIYPFFDGGGDFYILKFDQVVHAFLYGVVALMVLHLLREYFGIKRPALLIASIAVMASLGVSAVNEIIEFTAVLALPETGVGGYENTLLDIIFNFGGAVLAVAVSETVRSLRTLQGR